MMHFVIGVEVWHVYLRAKAKGRHEFVVVVVQHDVADFMEGLLVLASRVRRHVMQRSGLGLHTVTGREIYADYHRHLHAIGQVISKIVLDCLLEVLKHDQSLLRVPLGQGIPQVASAKVIEIRPSLSDQVMPGILVEPEYDGLFGVIIAQSLLIDPDRVVAIALAFLHLALIQQVLFLILYLVHLPM